MLSRSSRFVAIFTVIFFVTLSVNFLMASKMAGKFRSTEVPVSVSTSGSGMATISGSLLSWDGLGTENALLSASDVERLGVSLKREGFSEAMNVKVDGRGRFNTGTILPGVYELEISYDGRGFHTHKVEVTSMDTVSLEVGFKHNGTLPNVYVRGFGPSSSTGDVALSDETFLSEYLSTGAEQIASHKTDAVFDELEAPVEVFRYRAGAMSSDNESWDNQALPTALPSFGAGTVIIDPDVNVSKLHESLKDAPTSLDLTAI